ncbi:hypothetical protein ACI79J_12705 [Geodermatophilus sp. SYSU D01062]
MVDMSGSRYRVAINGFWCHNETWDDVFNWDGKHDEVFLSVNTKVVDDKGTVLDNLNSESELMGDTWQLPGRVQAGSASDRGGIVSGDKFPWDRPMIRQDSLNTTLRVPPYVIWEGELPSNRLVFLTPTIWEWDPGAGAWDGWLDWQKQTDEKYGDRAEEIFGKIWPISKPVFDAVSLGIQTFATLAGLWSPLGQSMRRPIGLQRDPANPNGSLFNPVTIALNTETADYLATSNPQGHGNGIRELVYADDPYLRGVYSIYLQVEMTDGGTPVVYMQSDWRWCDRCQGLFFGVGLATSRCPAGGTHADPAQSRSGNYSLPHNAPPSPSRQPEWRWCDKCQGLFYGPAVAGSVCPTGGTHSLPTQSGSGNYSLPHNVAPSPETQSDWRWCNKCQGLFFGGGLATSRCPAGGSHADPAQSGSGNYSLPHKAA